MGRRALPGAAYLLAILVVVFAIFGSGFATVANGLNIGVQSTILLLLALPMTLVIMTEGLDLSMGAVLTLASIVLALTLLATQSLALGIPPFVATLGTLGIAQGLALIVSDGQSIVGLPRFVREVYAGSLFGLPL